MERQRILVVEDDPALQKQLRWALDDYEVVLADNRADALAQVRRCEPAVVTLDLGLPPAADGVSEGFAVLQGILDLAPHTKVIMLTGNVERAHALRAVGLGAYDYQVKPVEVDALRLMVQRAFHLHELESENRRLAAGAHREPLAGLITGDRQMLQACRTIEKVAPTGASVLILGPSGSGKEVMARALHTLSGRSGRFVAINCAAIPEALLESELFGYERGAFTGAVRQTIGKIEYADKGTLFLDEIGDLPASLQAKLLRFLQERVVERLGGRGEIEVDVRVVSATHQDLAGMMQRGEFREDLYYRIAELGIRLPPLRERLGDAVLLAHAFLARFRAEHKKAPRGFTPDALAAIESYPWPGNVRELDNAIKRVLIMAEGALVTAEDLNLPTREDAAPPVPLNLRKVRDEAERLAAARALAHTNGNMLQAAELLGVSRPTLYDIVNKHGLK